jgi:hypothetical protein
MSSSRASREEKALWSEIFFDGDVEGQFSLSIFSGEKR